MKSLIIGTAVLFFLAASSLRAAPAEERLPGQELAPESSFLEPILLESNQNELPPALPSQGTINAALLDAPLSAATPDAAPEELPVPNQIPPNTGDQQGKRAAAQTPLTGTPGENENSRAHSYYSLMESWNAQGTETLDALRDTLGPAPSRAIDELELEAQKEKAQAALVSSLPSLPAAARLQTPELRQVRKASWLETQALRQMWKSPRPQTVATPQGKRPLTFSFDAEIGAADVMRLLLKDPESFSAFEKHVKIKLSGNYADGRIPAEVLAREIGLSPKALHTFALRPGISKNEPAYFLTDLKPAYFDRVINGYRHYGLDGDVSNVNEILQAAAKAQNLPVKIKYDIPSSRELAHESWEESPSAFKAIFARLFALFQSPQPHLHLGIPVDIGNEAFCAVARAIETKIILALAAEDPAALQKQSSLGSTLGSNSNLHIYGIRSWKGLVRASSKRWDRPHRSHDFEIRNYFSPSQGLELLALAAKLAQQHHDLKLYQGEFPRFAKHPSLNGENDAYTVNLIGALHYAGIMLSDEPEQTVRNIGKDLLVFAQSLRGVAEVPLELRQKVAQYLRLNSVNALLTKNRFLKKAPPELRSLKTSGFAVLPQGRILPAKLAQRLLAEADQKFGVSGAPEKWIAFNDYYQDKPMGQMENPGRDADGSNGVMEFARQMEGLLRQALPSEPLRLRLVELRVRDSSRDPGFSTPHLDADYITVSAALRGPGTVLYKITKDGKVLERALAPGEVGIITDVLRELKTGISATLHSSPEETPGDRVLLLLRFSQKDAPAEKASRKQALARLNTRERKQRSLIEQYREQKKEDLPEILLSY